MNSKVKPNLEYTLWTLELDFCENCNYPGILTVVAKTEEEARTKLLELHFDKELFPYVNLSDKDIKETSIQVEVKNTLTNTVTFATYPDLKTAISRGYIRKRKPALLFAALDS